MNGPYQIVFGPFRLDSHAKRLWRGDQALTLRPRSFAVLQHLAEHPGQVVSGQKLIEHVWSGTHVTDTVLRVCIREIREVLHDTSNAPSYIETVRRQGYRFLQTAMTHDRAVATPAQKEDSHPIVGRQTELAYLQACLHRAAQGARGLVLINGETGVGKTTLVDHFLSHAGQLGNLRIGRGHSIEQDGHGEPYLPVLEALGQLCREPGGEAVTSLLRHYAPTWVLEMPSLLSDAELNELLRQHHHAHPKRMLREITEALDAVAATTPLTLVFEDLHWADTSTLELIAFLAQWRPSAHLLVMGTYRPEDTTHPHHPLKRLIQELHGRRLCNIMSISPLTQPDIATYAAAYLQGPLAEDLADFIHRQTEGNALFMVNMLEHLRSHHYLTQRHQQWALRQDATLETIGLPEPLQQLIAKRINSLDNDEQRILEAASVNGITFSTLGVAACLVEGVETIEHQCEKLAAKGALIEPNGLAEWPDQTLCGHYRFQHTLYQQVVYQQISPSRRLQYHRRLGERLETDYWFQPQEVVPELAQHFTAGKDSNRALIYRCQAGKQALSQHAYQEAGQHCLSALDIITQRPDTPERAHHTLAVHLILGTVLADTWDDNLPTTATTYRDLREQYWDASDNTLLCPTLYGLWNRFMLQGECQTAHDLAAQLMQRTRSDTASTFRPMAHQAYGCTSYWQGDLTPARQYLEESVTLFNANRSLAQPLPYGADVLVIALSHLALVLWHLGYADQAHRTSQNARRLAATTGSTIGQNGTLILTAMLHQLCGDAAAVQSLLGPSKSIEMDHAFPLWITWHNALQGWARSQLYPDTTGRLKMEQALHDLSTTGVPLGRPYMLTLLAEAHGKLGHLDAGLSVLDEAAQLVQTTEAFVVAPQIDYVRAQLLMHRGTPSDLKQAEAHLHQVITTARRQTAITWELRASLALDRQWPQPGPHHHSALKAVYRKFTEGFDTADLRQAAARLRPDQPPYESSASGIDE